MTNPCIVVPGGVVFVTKRFQIAILKIWASKEIMATRSSPKKSLTTTSTMMPKLTLKTMATTSALVAALQNNKG